MMQQQQQQQQRPQECGVCLLVYEEQERRPRTLPCGHTFCFVCVAALLQDGHLICPSCRADHLAPSPDSFPISYVLEAMVRELQAALQAVGGTSGAAGEASLPTPKGSQAREVERKQKAAAGLSRKLQSMIQEQETSLGSMAVTLQQELDQLSQYRAQLALSQAEHGCLLEELDKLAQQHRAAIELLREEDVRVEAFMQEGQEVQREVRAAQGQLQQVSTSRQAFSIVDGTDRTTMEAEEWLQHSREEMPNSTALSTSCKVVEVTKAAVEAARTAAEAMPDHHTSGHLHCTIMEAVDMLKERPLKLADLWSERLTKRLEGGRVFAVQEYENGTCHSSRIRRVGTEMLLLSLKPGSPPAGSFTLKVSEALEDLDYQSSLVFLDLSWPGVPTHRVHIRMESDNPLRQFVARCLGHEGRTYCNTKFLRVQEGRDHSIVWVGHFYYDTAAKRHQLPALHDSECVDRVTPRRGMVVATTDLSNIALYPVFGIVIAGGDKCYANIPYYYCLGHVQNAEVSFVEAAVSNTIAMKDIQVMECGVVLSQ